MHGYVKLFGKKNIEKPLKEKSLNPTHAEFNECFHKPYAHWF